MESSPFDGIEVIIGTYEHYLVGYWLKSSSDSENKFYFEQSFSEAAHNGSVKCIASSGRFVVSGGTDETIRIFDIANRKDVGTLMKQEDTITCLKFYQNSHLFSSSDNGTICVWDVRNWHCLKTLQGHKLGVRHLSVHSSGKLLLSISKDKALRTWNLVKGRCAYVTNIKAIANSVYWTPESSHFLIVFDRHFDMYDIDLGACIYSFETDKAITCISFLNYDTVLVGLENGVIEFYSLDKKTFISRFPVHENRVKDMYCLHRHDRYWLFSVSSDGHIKCWKVKKIGKLELIASIQTSCRINCLTLHVPEESSVSD